MIAAVVWLRTAGTMGFRSKASTEGKGNSAAEKKGKGEKKEKGITLLNPLVGWGDGESPESQGAQ